MGTATRGSQMITDTPFYPITPGNVTAELAGLPDDLQHAVIEWWNESRRSRHGTKAVWTRRAFAFSSTRVQAAFRQDPGLARRLVDAGIEIGWMALKMEYLHGQTRHQAQANNGRVQQAIALWNNAQAQH